ncbi:D-cysteine desulfhydrase family protein [Piscinibacter sp. XHJ-5]|uniref:D-cysteine desulfhydrase family protein n=1 Tax=Piscinibacter sp. XHJ-5 TaxID=3037797 RepID=UPI0024534E97|nr:D-cysteine desulfhydrase family protein [Piscinibacter sp. XHJ-5]
MSVATRFDRYSRVRLLAGPTPIQRLHRVEAALGPAINGTRLFVKRDDATGLGGGGGKLRKLEFLLAEALDQGADTLIATGPRQSNSARLAAAAAASIGLRCELGLRPLTDGDAIDYRESGNPLLADLFGATIHALDDAGAVGSFVAERQKALAADGRVGYVLPFGASSARSSLGYAECALEIADQEHALGIRFDRVVVANGSAGTQAGLVAGFALLDRHALVHGFAVFANPAAAHANTLELARGAHALLAAGGEVGVDDVIVSDARGPGYGEVTPEAIDAIRILAANEGLLLDPVYSGKAFAGLLSQVRHGDLADEENILFIMTGGTPALFAYREALSVPPAAC